MSFIISFISNLVWTMISLGIATGIYFLYEPNPQFYLIMIIPLVNWVRWGLWLRKLSKQVKEDERILREKRQNPTLPKPVKDGSES